MEDKYIKDVIFMRQVSRKRTGLISVALIVALVLNMLCAVAFGGEVDEAFAAYGTIGRVVSASYEDGKALTDRKSTRLNSSH